MKKILLLAMLLFFACQAEVQNTGNGLFCGANEEEVDCDYRYGELQKTLKLEEVKEKCDKNKDAVFCVMTVPFYVVPFYVNVDNENVETNKEEITKYWKKALEYAEKPCKDGNTYYCGIIAKGLQLMGEFNKAREYAQKSCLSGKNPNICRILSDLYQDEEALTGDDLAFIQAVKNKDMTKVEDLQTKLCPKNPAACYSLGLSLSNKGDKQKAYNYLSQACDKGIADACYAASTLSDSLKNRILLLEKSCNYGFFLGGVEPCSMIRPVFACGVGGFEKDLKKFEKYSKMACYKGYYEIDEENCAIETKKLVESFNNEQCNEIKERLK